MSESPGKKAFKRLLRNKSAVFGMVVIILSVILAILGYAITPDSTPLANDQVLEISNKEPGFTITMLHKRKNVPIEQRNFFSKMFSGQPNPYDLVPINGYEVKGDSLLVQAYAGSSDRSDPQMFALADVVFELDASDPQPNTSNGRVTYKHYDGSMGSASIDSLQQIVTTNLIYDKTYPMGTDRFGRDVLSRLIIGVRISLFVGLVAVFISLVLGITLGALAGYYGGVVDDLIMWLINVVWSIPTILLVFGISFALGKGDVTFNIFGWSITASMAFLGLFSAIGLTMWVETARVVRGQVLSVKAEQFVEASQSMGFSDARTIFRHILPNIIGPIIVISAANFATAILVEAGLSYLGLGVESTVPTWGRMLSENYGYIISESKSYLALTPGIAIMLMVLAFNLIGNGLRDALDIKTSLQGNR